MQRAMKNVLYIFPGKNKPKRALPLWQKQIESVESFIYYRNVNIHTRSIICVDNGSEQVE